MSGHLSTPTVPQAPRDARIEPTARKVKLGGCPLRSAALTRVSLRRFWSSSLIDGQKMAGFCPLDKLHTSVSCPKLGHPHRHNEAILDILPPRYRNGKVVSSAPMGTAPMRYTDEGQVAWDQMWTDFCELALAGGPPHRDTLLEPVAPEEVKVDQDDYERVVSEIERGLRLVTGLSTVCSATLE
jgi:hypothetical protein